MVTKPKKSIASRLQAAQLAIGNTLANAEVQALVAEYGYDAARMAEGQQLYEAAVDAVNARAVAWGAQLQATDEARAAERVARDAFQALSAVARAVFVSDPTWLVALGLTGPTPRPRYKFLTVARILFDNALASEEIGAQLARYGYDRDRLESEQAKIVILRQLDAAQDAAKAAAQQATEAQTEALDALQAWLAQYLKIARVALRGREQLLEMLGIRA